MFIYFSENNLDVYSVKPELKEPRKYALKEIKCILENHKDETNRTLDDLLKIKGENGKLFEGGEYPFLLSVPVIYPNNAENISMLYFDVI